MQLALETNEQEILAWALQSTVSDLGGEIADTENQEFREDLKGKGGTAGDSRSSEVACNGKGTRAEPWP